eukprot:scaffold9692_cov117-Skeletonema_dohrnii-CCMP3373.AAC.9
MTKPASSQSSLNPWESLLVSATRARPSQDSSASTSSSPLTTSDAILGGGYTILLQHSMTPKSQRKWALESTIANVDSNSNNSTTNNASLSSQFASSLSIQQQHHANNQTSSSSASARRAGGDWYGISGPFLVRQAFHDLSKKCNGRVVLVSVAGTSGICDLDQEYNDDAAYDHQSRTDDDKNNVDVVKLFHRNGACVDLNSNPFGWNDENNNHDSCNDDDSFSTKATLNNMLSIATAIRQAASRIEERNNEQQSQQPIPIIFDSLTPLLHLHGAERITILLKSLGRTSPPLDNSSSSTNSSLCLSPIIAPILYESICLSDHRTLEDCADAMVQLNLMDSNSTSTNYAIEAKDDSSVVVVSGVMDLVRRGGGGSNGLGGKLMRHCVPVHILRSLSTTGDLRDGCYWIIDNGDDGNTARDGDATEKKGKKQTSSSSTTDEMGQSQSTDNSSRPKIYLEDDDPDFQDYDEDDDLDL